MIYLDSCVYSERSKDLELSRDVSEDTPRARVPSKTIALVPEDWWSARTVRQDAFTALYTAKETRAIYGEGGIPQKDAVAS